MPPRLVDIAPVLAAMEQGGGQVCSKQLLKLLPVVDAVPVVRCAGCKHYHAETGYCDKNSHFIDSEGMSCSPAESPNWTIWDENDFCSYGERKDGEP